MAMPGNLGPCVLSLGVCLSAACATGQVRWRHGDVLPESWAARAVYDAQSGRVLLFGGRQGPTHGYGTWEWDGERWFDLQTANEPSSVIGHALAYDEARRRAVLFGGFPSNGLGDETWEWDGVDWIRRRPATSPSPRRWHAMAYDPDRRRIVLFGGYDLTRTLDETWEWDGNDWQRMPTAPVSTPRRRIEHAMAFDPVRRRVVLHAGRPGPRLNPPLEDMWEWDGTAWTEIPLPAGVGPAGRTGHGLVRDDRRGRLVLYGGEVAGDETWEWDGQMWLLARSGSPPGARSQAAMAYDRARGVVVMTGGGANPGTVPPGPGGTWEWDGSRWEQRAPASPDVRSGCRLAVDYAQGGVLLFGGNAAFLFPNPTDTWRWSGGAWNLLAPTNAPARRSHHGMASDPFRGRIVLFGGELVALGGPGSLLGDTWEWTGQDWMARTTPVAPTPRRGAAMAFDPVRRRALLFGGEGPPGVLLDDSWEWDGVTWRRLTPAIRPSPRAFHSMAYDAARQQMVLFGPDTWEWDGRTWTRPSVSPEPSVLTRTAMVYDQHRARVVLFGGEEPFGRLSSAVWEYDGTSWNRRSPAVSPPARADHAMSFDPLEGETIVFGDAPTLAQRPDTWLYGAIHPARVESFGTGCRGSGGTPYLTATSRPWIGAPLELLVLNLPPSGGPVILLLADSRRSWSGLPLPASLTRAGMPGCHLYVGPVATSVGNAPGTSLARTLMLPADPRTVGRILYVQALVSDPAAGNAAGFVTSNGLAALVGSP